MDPLSSDGGGLTIHWSPISAVEAMSVAAHENTHTALWLWLLGLYSALSKPDRLLALTALTGLTNVEQWELQSICREHGLEGGDRLDLVMRYDDHQGVTHFVVIENKLKSSQGDNQLEDYRQQFQSAMAKQIPFARYHWVFLTLVGEEANDKAWVNRTYRQLLEGLRPLANKNAYLGDYVQFLERIVALVCSVEGGQTAWLFDKTNVVKDAILVNQTQISDMVLYARTMKLVVLLQKVALAKLGLQVACKASWLSGYAVGETNGEGLLDLHFTTAKRSPERYQVGVQLQGGRAKLFVYPILDKRANASLKQTQECSQILGEFRQVVSANKAKPTKSRGKGFTSIPLGTIPYTTEAILKILEPFARWQKVVS